MHYSIQGGQEGLTPNNLVTNVAMTKMTHENLFKLRAKLLVCDETTKNKTRISVM